MRVHEEKSATNAPSTLYEDRMLSVTCAGTVPNTVTDDPVFFFLFAWYESSGASTMQWDAEPLNHSWKPTPGSDVPCDVLRGRAIHLRDKKNSRRKGTYLLYSFDAPFVLCAFQVPVYVMAASKSSTITVTHHVGWDDENLAGCEIEEEAMSMWRVL